MIDLRSHILDGMPCGPDSFDASLEMCRAAAADGVRTLVATPHWEAGRQEPPLPFDECLRKLRSLEAEMRAALSLRLGFVLQFSPELPALVERHGPLLALAEKRWLLVSLSSLEVPAGAERVWGGLGRAGFSVVLAHPECNPALRRDPERLGRWVAEGLALQFDAASVGGAHGREVRRFTVECLRKYQGRVVVASNARHGDDRKVSLGRAREVLAGEVGAASTADFVRETPAALIGDGARRLEARGRSARGLATLFRSFGPLKALAGE
jgi:protein-tyrosine phosphatase